MYLAAAAAAGGGSRSWTCSASSMSPCICYTPQSPSSSLSSSSSSALCYSATVTTANPTATTPATAGCTNTVCNNTNNYNGELFSSTTTHPKSLTASLNATSSAAALCASRSDNVALVRRAISATAPRSSRQFVPTAAGVCSGRSLKC